MVNFSDEDIRRFEAEREALLQELAKINQRRDALQTRVIELQGILGAIITKAKEK